MSKLQRLTDRANAALTGHPRLALLVLALLYLFLQLPRLWVVSFAYQLQFPLESIVMGQRQIFHGLSLNPALADMLITPVNGILIYPPGLYVLAALLGNLKAMYIFLLLVQLPVPLLTYRLLARFAPPLTAWLIAAIGAYHFVNAAWWQPDLLIQPLMLSALMLLTAAPRPAARTLVAIGLLTGLITVFKHNIGIFFAIMVGSWLFMSCFHQKQSRTGGGLTAFILLAGFFVFAAYFASRLLHGDEIIYFLLPYMLFWGLFASWLAQRPHFFDQRAFFIGAGIYTAATLALPLAVFVWFASVMGAERYFHSLFHMGMENMHVWDIGLANAIAVSMSFADPAHAYRSLVMLVFYAVPFVAGLYAVLELYRQSRREAAELIDAFRVAALPVMAVFMLFPLEGPHILITKLTVFLLGAVHLLTRYRPRLLLAATLLAALAVGPVLAYGVGHVWLQSHTPATPGGPALQRMVKLPVSAPLAREVDQQVKVVERSIGRQSFYVVDSSDGALWSLAVLTDIEHPQHHVVMLRGLLNDSIVAAIEAEMAAYDFAIVNHEEYVRALDGRGNNDPGLDSLYRHVRDNFTLVARYEAPMPIPKPLLGILSFDVMRRVRPGVPSGI